MRNFNKIFSTVAMLTISKWQLDTKYYADPVEGIGKTTHPKLVKFCMEIVRGSNCKMSGTELLNLNLLAGNSSFKLSNKKKLLWAVFDRVVRQK